MPEYPFEVQNETAGSVRYRGYGEAIKVTAKPSAANQVLAYTAITPDITLGPVTLDNSYLANRTRRIYIPAVAFSAAGTGAPTFAVTGGASVGFPNWALDGTNDEDVVTEVGLPQDWAGGNITPYIVWAPTDTNTGNVAWRIFINSQNSGAAANAAIEVNSGTVVSAATAVQYDTIVHSMGSLAAGTGTEVPTLRITVYRFASDAADTYNAHDAHFRGIYIEYTADS